MAKPSYYPLSPLKPPLGGAASPSPEQSLKDDSDLPHLADTVGVDDPSGSRSSMFLAPSQLFRKGSSAHCLPLWHGIKTPLEMALLPLAAIGYLAFCYTVHGKVVPVNTYGLYAVTPQHLATIKGGITSISIIIVSIALYPIYNILSNLRSEEFFRVLASHSHGVPLGTVNHISTPSFGNIDMMMAMWKHTCSKYYILAIVASLLIWIVTTLAPGTLTIDSVLADRELMAFAIGAVPAQSVLNGTYPAQPAFNASLNAAMAASIAWAEIELGVQWSFGVANPSEPDYAAQYFATAYLLDFNLDVQVNSLDMGSEYTPFATVKDPIYAVTNHTTRAPASDGSTVFLLGQCQSGCLAPTPVDITLDLTGLNTTFTIALTDQTWSMAILACIPNITIETREVRNDGHGVLTVQPLPAGNHLTRQGNLNPVQTTALFSIATMSLTQSAGALSGNHGEYFTLGSQVQGDVLFGKAQFEGLPGINAPVGTSATISPAPIEDITQGYTQILQSAAKCAFPLPASRWSIVFNLRAVLSITAYLAGYLGTAYVPGRISASEIVFAASIPNLAVSSAVFVLLAALIVLAHFRPGKGIEFTLVNVTAAVHGSELPAQFAQIKAEQAAGVYGHADMEAGAEGDKGRHVGCDPSDDHQDIMEMMGERRIFMQRRVDGSPVLHIS
ncbi:hypothetical protein J3R83DRAFT_294 [Lanmaoa asiatica]|nr:hypothetical protein J3R83DRAFT_294 [Lanmaoa asiatica]